MEVWLHRGLLTWPVLPVSWCCCPEEARTRATRMIWLQSLDGLAHEAGRGLSHWKIGQAIGTTCSDICKVGVAASALRDRCVKARVLDMSKFLLHEAGRNKRLAFDSNAWNVCCHADSYRMCAIMGIIPLRARTPPCILDDPDLSLRVERKTLSRNQSLARESVYPTVDLLMCLIQAGIVFRTNKVAMNSVALAEPVLGVNPQD
jgi:hypothetical protein